MQNCTFDLGNLCSIYNFIKRLTRSILTRNFYTEKSSNKIHNYEVKSNIQLISYILKRQVSFLDITKDFGGLMSLQLILMLLIKLLAPDMLSGDIFSLIQPGAGLGFFIFLTIIGALHIFLSINYYVLNGLKNSKMKLNPYYQLVIANIIYFAVNYVIGMLITA